MLDMFFIQTEPLISRENILHFENPCIFTQIDKSAFKDVNKIAYKLPLQIYIQYYVP